VFSLTLRSGSLAPGVSKMIRNVSPAPPSPQYNVASLGLGCFHRRIVVRLRHDREQAAAFAQHEVNQVDAMS